MISTLVFMCGHKTMSEFAYSQAAKTWKKWAKSELCSECKKSKGE